MACFRLTLISLAALLVFVSSQVQADTYYRWVDENGVLHMTNNPDNVPKGDKYKITVEEMAPPEAPPQKPPAASSAPEPPAKPEYRPPAKPDTGDEPQAPQPSASEMQKMELQEELDRAQAALQYCEKSGYQYLKPEIVTEYLTKDDLSNLRQYGLFDGVPKVKRIDTLYYMRKKVERLKQELAQY
jgi:hypothetical protein